jgi:hypothetical protein
MKKSEGKNFCDTVPLKRGGITKLSSHFFLGGGGSCGVKFTDPQFSAMSLIPRTNGEQYQCLH